jgi:hypothetical protein
MDTFRHDYVQEPEVWRIQGKACVFAHEILKAVKQQGTNTSGPRRYNYVTPQGKWDAVMTQEALFRQIDQLYINMLSAAPTLGFVYSTPAEFALFVNERAYKNIDSFKFGSELPFHKLNRRPPLSCLMRLARG